MDIEISTSPSIRDIDHTDQHFTIVSGMVIARRASIEVDAKCPREYLMILAHCLDRGWIKPVAHVTEDEYMIMQLSN
jgi:hypothetical protein